jgi:hypothetical protein
VRLSIDDFGTGYSSLSYLKRFPVDIIKIDRSFVQDLPQDSDDAAIVSAIIALAHSLRLQVVAEGVETDAQLDFLARRCDMMQGYHLSPAVPADQFEDLARRALKNKPGDSILNKSSAQRLYATAALTLPLMPPLTAHPGSDDDELALVYGAGDSVSIATGNLQALRRAPAVASSSPRPTSPPWAPRTSTRYWKAWPASTSTARPTAIRRCTWCAASSAPSRRRS